MSKTSTQSKKKYNQKAYDRTLVTFKKNQLDLLRQTAKEHGCSVNSLITDAVTEYLWDEFAIDFNNYPKPESKDGTE